MLKHFQWRSMSKMRRVYTLRLIGRCIVLILSALIWAFFPGEFEVMDGWNFFRRFSVLHILWVIWFFDMLAQLIPYSKKIPLGSAKLFRLRYIPVRGKISRSKLKSYILSTTKAAGWVLILWIALTLGVGMLRWKNTLDDSGMFLISVLFYVCDLICVLIWCPFRLIMKNRCCTTCRIFNWDHMMMFSPLLFTKGFYSWSLIVMAVGALLLWEACVLLYPERFWDHTNEALKCANCTDKLCTQFCQKIR